MDRTWRRVPGGAAGPATCARVAPAGGAAAHHGAGAAPGRRGGAGRRGGGGRAAAARGARRARAANLEPEVASSTADLADITEWQIDFSSRPLIDDRKKKIWELNVCDASGRLRHAEYFPNNKVNSVTLRKALQGVAERYGAPLPERAIFFRVQMQTIISTALKQLGVETVPSMRCHELMDWLEERTATVYPAHPDFDPNAAPSLLMDVPQPTDLPEAMIGEQWEFVQFPLAGVEEEVREVEAGRAFGAVFDVAKQQVGRALGPDDLIPGVVVFSRRAKPISALHMGLEISGLRAYPERGYTVLEYGGNQGHKYSFFDKMDETLEEAVMWEKSKAELGGLHFLAVMESPEADMCTGFWILRSREPPSI